MDNQVNSRMTALITGCNRGLGKAIMENYAEHGFDIIACVRNISDEFKSYAEGIQKKYGIKIIIYKLDLSDEDNINVVAKEIFKSKVKINVLVNNAGIVTKSLLAMTSIKQLKDVFQVNFFGQVQLTQAVSKIMMHQKSGCIINICSIGGMDAFPAYTSYGCSKAAMTYFTKTISKELAPYGIRVNGVAPGMAATDMQKQLVGEANDEVLHRTALGRVAEPKEIADLVYYLSTSQASYITGQIIRIDGGM